jgi:hypothetical protein
VIVTYEKMKRLTYADLATPRALKDGLCPRCGRLVLKDAPVVVEDGATIRAECAARDAG